MSSVLAVKMTVVLARNGESHFFFSFLSAPCAIFVPGINRKKNGGITDGWDF